MGVRVIAVLQSKGFGKPLWLSILQQRPKSCLPRMHFSQPLHELLVRLETRVVLNLRIQAINLTDMPGRVFVACGTTFTQCDIDEGAPEQNRGQWIFAFDGPRGWIKQLVTVAVDFLCPREDQSGGTLVGRPPHQKCQCHVDIGMSAYMVERPLFRLEVFKVG